MTTEFCLRCYICRKSDYDCYKTFEEFVRQRNWIIYDEETFCSVECLNDYYKEEGEEGEDDNLFGGGSYKGCKSYEDYFNAHKDDKD